MSGKINLSKREVTHKEQNYGTEIHEALHSRLVEEIMNQIRVFVVTLITDPQYLFGIMWYRQTASADELELEIQYFRSSGTLKI